jgi:hypothetical protein
MMIGNVLVLRAAMGVEPDRGYIKDSAVLLQK